MNVHFLVVIANNITNEVLSIFKCMRRIIGKSTSRVLKTKEWTQAHLFVLSNVRKCRHSLSKMIV